MFVSQPFRSPVISHISIHQTTEAVTDISGGDKRVKGVSLFFFFIIVLYPLEIKIHKYYQLSIINLRYILLSSYNIINYVHSRRETI